MRQNVVDSVFNGFLSAQSHINLGNTLINVFALTTVAMLERGLELIQVPQLLGT